MITLKHVKYKYPPIGIGRRVRAVRMAADGVFNVGAEGTVIELDKNHPGTKTMTVRVRFDHGDYIHLDDRWWGYKEDFMVIG